MKSIAALLSRLNRRRVIEFFIACVIAFSLEHFVEHEIYSGSTSIKHTVFEISSVYQWLLRIPRKPRQEFTAVVVIDRKKEANGSISLYRLCRERDYLAKLIQKIADGSPAVIVLDKYFAHDICESTDTGTRRLENSIADISQKMPVLIGRLANKQDGSGYYLEPTLTFPPRVEEGIVNLNPDNRRLPLQWNVYPNEESTEKETIDTLSLKAAELKYQTYGQEIGKMQPRLAWLLSHGNHPYIGFLEKNELKEYTAGEVYKWSSDELRRFAGKVALIGESEEGIDRHDSVIGEVPGVVLQANYIEALLDNRYYPSFTVLNYLLGIMLFIAIVYSVDEYQGQPAKLIGGVAASLIVAGLILYILIIHLNIYVNLVTISIFGLVTLLSHSVQGLTTTLSHYLFPTRKKE